MFKKRVFLIVTMGLLSMAILTGSARGERLNVLGKPFDIWFQASQVMNVGWQNDFDTANGVNSALTTLLSDFAYYPNKRLKLAGQIGFTGDWAYQLNSSRDSWNDKQFNKSRGHLNVDDKYWQVMKELHLTWTPGDFMFRVGKQIISCGQTDGLRLIDQINPQDQRRGFADVEFETTIIPIWLVRADYNPAIKSTWL